MALVIMHGGGDHARLSCPCRKICTPPACVACGTDIAPSDSWGMCASIEHQACVSRDTAGCIPSPHHAQARTPTRQHRRGRLCHPVMRDFNNGGFDVGAGMALVVMHGGGDYARLSCPCRGAVEQSSGAQTPWHGQQRRGSLDIISACLPCHCCPYVSMWRTCNSPHRPSLIPFSSLCVIG